MNKQIYSTPTETNTNDGSPFVNVINTTKEGNLDIVTTGSTINSLAADKHTVVGAVYIQPNHHKVIPTDLNVNGDITVASDDDIMIGDDLVHQAGYLGVNGFIHCTGTMDIQGDLDMTTDIASTPTPTPLPSNIKGGTMSAEGWTLIEDGPYSGLYQKIMAFDAPFDDNKYAVTVQPLNMIQNGFITVINKNQDSFMVVMGTQPSDVSQVVDWIAVKY